VSIMYLHLYFPVVAFKCNTMLDCLMNNIALYFNYWIFCESNLELLGSNISLFCECSPTMSPSGVEVHSNWCPVDFHMSEVVFSALYSK